METATCTICGREGCKVRAQHTQNSARFGAPDNSRFLGLFGYCPDCQCSFAAPEPQLTLTGEEK